MTIPQKGVLPVFFLFLSLTGSIVNSCYAQQYKIDSLETIISGESHDTLRVSAMKNLFKLYLHRYPQKAEVLCHQIIDLSRKLKDKKSEASGYNSLGIVYNQLNYSPDSVMAMFDKANHLASSIKDNEFKSNVLSNIAIQYRNKGLDDKALELNNKALKLLGENEVSKTKAKILNNNGVIFHARDNIEMALDYFKQALSIYGKLGLNANYVHSCINIATVNTDNNAPDTAIVYLEKAMHFQRDKEGDFLTVRILGEMGRAYLVKKENKKSWDLISEAFNLSKTLNNEHSHGYTIFLLANYANELKDDEKAIKYSLEGLKIIESQDMFGPKISYYGYLRDAYTRLGDYQQAFEAQKNYHLLKDSVYNMDREKHIQNLMVQHETKHKEAENKLLAATISKQQNQLFLLIALLLTLFGFIAAFISILKVRHVNKIEEMRIGIAQDLHDEIGSKLTLLQIYNNKIFSSPESKHPNALKKIEQNINAVIKDAHFAISDLVWAINPKANSLKDLITRLNDYIDDLLAPVKIPYEFEYGIIQSEKKLDPNIRQNILLIFKEAINNILKHTDSSFVKVKLFKANNTFNIEITNTFDTIKTDSFSGGRGLKNMQYRAKKIGAQLLIDKKSNEFKLHLNTKLAL